MAKQKDITRPQKNGQEMPYQHFNMILCKGTSPEFAQPGLSVSIRVHHLLSIFFLIIALEISFVKWREWLTRKKKRGIIYSIQKRRFL